MLMLDLRNMINLETDGYYTIGLEKAGKIRDSDWIDFNPLTVNRATKRLKKEAERGKFDKAIVYSYHDTMKELINIPLLG